MPSGVTINTSSDNPSGNRPKDPNNDITDKHYGKTVTSTSMFDGAASGLRSSARPYLVVVSGKDQGKRFELAKQINLIGRNENADIVIMESRMSRDHGRLIIFPDRIFIEDHNSTNGTFVDGVRIDKTALGPKSRIRIGDTVMKIDYKDPNEAEFEDALFAAANTDALTGVLNRRAFMARATEEKALCRGKNSNLAVAMCDCDHFKRINDTFSHIAGDHVLRELANLIASKLRDGDEVGRYGGEEFIILMPNIKEQTGLSICEQIRSGIENHRFEFQGTAIPCTISMGFCLRQGPEIPDLEALIQCADQALLTAKKSGRNRIETA